MDFNAPPPDDDELPVLLADLTARAEHADLDVRRQAIEKIYELALKVGEKAAVAVPVLVGGLVDPDPKIGESSLWALKYCAPHSIEALAECLSHPTAFVRERAAHSLGNVGDEARAAAGKLRELLDDPEQSVRKRAARALGLLHDSQPETVLPLIRMVTVGTSEDGAAALHALGNIARGADTADFLAPYRREIVAALEHPQAEVRRWCLYAAESVGLDSQAFAALLVTVVRRDRESDVRVAALSRLKTLAPLVDLADAVPALISRLVDDGAEARSICEVLGAVRPSPVEAIPALRTALSHDELVLPAASALWKIEARAETILPALKRVFDHNGEGVCDLISELGPAAAPLLPEVVEALSREDWDLQWAAADALAAIASSDREVVSTLVDALGHSSPIVRSASARALAATGVSALDSLIALLRNSTDARATWAAYALGEMGSVAAPALPELRAGMHDGEQPLAGCCAVAIARVAADVIVLPYLVATLESHHPHAPRRAAALALAEFGPAATDAVGALEALLEIGDQDVVNAALQALSSIGGAMH
jgi:HEAT repeat protein